jgi:hypothetical protein
MDMYVNYRLRFLEACATLLVNYSPRDGVHRGYAHLQHKHQQSERQKVSMVRTAELFTLRLNEKIAQAWSGGSGVYACFHQVILLSRLVVCGWVCECAV